MDLKTEPAAGPHDGLGPELCIDPSIGDAAPEPAQFVTFRIDTEKYAVNIMAVCEIRGWTGVTALPNQPDYMRGVLNLRGVVVPVFDLRCRFTGKLTDVTSKHVVVIVTVHDRTMGMLVDSVSEILTTDAADIKPVPEVDQNIKKDFLSGLVSVDHHMVVILDLQELMSTDQSEISSAR